MKVKVPNSINELTLKQYLDFSKQAEQVKDDGSIESMLATYKLIEILCGATEDEVDALKLEEMSEITNKAKELIDTFKGFESKDSIINIDGVDYMAQKMEDLDNGEYISLNILKEKYGNDLYALYPKLLAILIRPAVKKFDEEKNEEYFEVEPFNRRDITNMEYRANLFLQKAKASDVIPVINFFLSTKQTSV